MADSMRKQLSYTAAEIDERLGAVPNKVDKETGKGLSTNDYTTAEKEKLGGLSGEDVFVLGTALSSGGDLNSLTTPDKWYASTAAIATSISNIPADVTSAFFGVTIPSVAGSRYIQLLVSNDDTGVWYKRRYTGSWQAWVKYSTVAAPYRTGTAVTSNSDLNDYTEPGAYQCSGPTIAQTLTNTPTTQPFRLEVKNFASGTSLIQEITAVDNTTSGEPVVFRRVKLASGWKPWYKFTGTVVT